MLTRADNSANSVGRAESARRDRLVASREDTSPPHWHPKHVQTRNNMEEVGLGETDAGVERGASMLFLPDRCYISSQDGQAQ